MTKYIVAGLHKEIGVVKLDTGRRYSLEEANKVRDRLKETCEDERKVLGFTEYVTINVDAESLVPPYHLY